MSFDVRVLQARKQVTDVQGVGGLRPSEHLGVHVAACRMRIRGTGPTVVIYHRGGSRSSG